MFIPVWILMLKLVITPSQSRIHTHLSHSQVKEVPMIMGSTFIAIFWVTMLKFLYLGRRMMDHYPLIIHFVYLFCPMRTSPGTSTKGWLGRNPYLVLSKIVCVGMVPQMIFELTMFVFTKLISS